MDITVDYTGNQIKEQILNSLKSNMKTKGLDKTTADDIVLEVDVLSQDGQVYRGAICSLKMVIHVKD